MESGRSSASSPASASASAAAAAAAAASAVNTGDSAASEVAVTMTSGVRSNGACDAAPGDAVAAAVAANSGASASASASAASASAATRSKRQELSFAERIQVILARKGGKSMRQLALQFGCGKTQILNILGQRESYLREWEEKEGPSNPHIGARKRRSRRTGNEETNRQVWDWYQQQKSAGLRVTGPMLQREARSIARSLGIANFAASNGWLDSFRRLHNIVSCLYARANLVAQQRLPPVPPVSVPRRSPPSANVLREFCAPPYPVHGKIP